MKREELLGKGFTEEQVTELLNMFHSQNKENETLKTQLAQANTKYSEVQKTLDDINRANLSNEEQIARDKEETQKNLRESKMILNETKVKNILAGYDIDDKLIKDLVKEDEAASIESANLLKTKLDIFKDTIEKQTRESITNMNTKPNPTNIPQTDNKMTKEKFMSMTMSEQKAWKDENINEYHELMN